MPVICKGNRCGVPRVAAGGIGLCGLSSRKRMTRFNVGRCAYQIKRVLDKPSLSIQYPG